MNFLFGENTIEVKICDDEGDEVAFRGMEEYLQKIYGAEYVGDGWAVGGSQEIYQKNYKIKKYTIALQTETYMAISIIGPKKLVTEIAKKVKKRKVEQGGAEKPAIDSESKANRSKDPKLQSEGRPQ